MNMFDFSTPQSAHFPRKLATLINKFMKVWLTLLLTHKYTFHTRRNHQMAAVTQLTHQLPLDTTERYYVSTRYFRQIP